MVPYERRQYILNMLQDEEIVKVKDIQEELSEVSVSTIRRDLVALEEKGQIVRLPGGAIKKFSRSADIPMVNRQTININSKMEIARLANDLIENGDCVYVDSGSTAGELLTLLLSREVTIVTSNAVIPDVGMDIRADIYSLGGKFNEENRSLYGELTLSNISLFHFDKSFLGINGVSLEFGYTTPRLPECMKKKLVIENSDISYFMADSSKVGLHYMSKVCALDGTDLISDEYNSELDRVTNLIVPSWIYKSVRTKTEQVLALFFNSYK